MFGLCCTAKLRVRAVCTYITYLDSQMARCNSKLKCERCPTCFKRFHTPSDVLKHRRLSRVDSICRLAYLEEVSETLDISDEINDEGDMVDSSRRKHGLETVYQHDPSLREPRHSKVHWSKLRGAEDIWKRQALDEQQDNQHVAIEDHTVEELTNELTMDLFPDAAKVIGEGQHLFQLFPSHSNVYHPFASKSEWELARWLMLSGLTVSSVADFLRQEYVSLSSKPGPMLTNHAGTSEPTVFCDIPSITIISAEPPTAPSVAVTRDHRPRREDKQTDCPILP